MKGHVIDLRSDTVTLPTKDMLGTVFQSPLGDSLRDEDPTVNRLQEKSAALFRKEDAL